MSEVGELAPDLVFVYRRKGDRKWAWHRTSPNGNVIATDGNQGYENKDDCEQMARHVNGEQGVQYVVEGDNDVGFEGVVGET